MIAVALLALGQRRRLPSLPVSRSAEELVFAFPSGAPPGCDRRRCRHRPLCRSVTSRRRGIRRAFGEGPPVSPAAGRLRCLSCSQRRSWCLRSLRGPRRGWDRRRCHHRPPRRSMTSRRRGARSGEGTLVDLQMLVAFAARLAVSGGAGVCVLFGYSSDHRRCRQRPPRRSVTSRRRGTRRAFREEFLVSGFRSPLLPFWVLR